MNFENLSDARKRERRKITVRGIAVGCLNMAILTLKKCTCIFLPLAHTLLSSNNALSTDPIKTNSSLWIFFFWSSIFSLNSYLVIHIFLFCGVPK